MSYFRTMDISASALTAQTLRIETISQNIANSQTTRTENGEAYRRKLVVMEERKGDFTGELQGGINKVNAGGGVRIARIIEDASPLRRVYEPGHPDADGEGYVFYPNVNPVTEMVNLISATRAYEANVTGINSTKSMAMKALEIGR
jgi:flagellar basal-body rod protein FlgC